MTTDGGVDGSVTELRTAADVGLEDRAPEVEAAAEVDAAALTHVEEPPTETGLIAVIPPEEPASETRLITVVEPEEPAEPAEPATETGPVADADVTPPAPEAKPAVDVGGPAMLELGRWVVTVAAVVVICLMVGGYGFGWSWTGLTRAVTLWDWMQALLLPVALGLAPVLLLYRGRLKRSHNLVLLGVLAAFAILVAAGYLVPLGWTGFPGNTLWDWFELALLPLVVTAAPVWVRANHVQRRHLMFAGAVLVVFGVFVLAGYTVPLSWTGFRDNTAWDWLKLLLLPVLLPTLVIPLLTSRVRRGLGAEGPAAPAEPARPAGD